MLDEARTRIVGGEAIACAIDSCWLAGMLQPQNAGEVCAYLTPPSGTFVRQRTPQQVSYVSE